MSDRFFRWAVAATLTGAIVWWHFTPWESMARWGPMGCGAARRVAHMVPKGCEATR